MSRYLHQGQTIGCGTCGLAVRIPPPPPRGMGISGRAVILEGQLLAAVLPGCRQSGSGKKPCARVVRIERGQDERLRIGPETPLTDELLAWTDGTPPQPVRLLGGTSMLGQGASTLPLILTLVDLDGLPWAGESVDVVLPDGTHRTLRLDAEGSARVEGLKGAVARVSPTRLEPPPCTVDSAAPDCLHERRPGWVIDTVVIHSMDGTLAGSRSWFRTAGRRPPTAAHYLVGRDGAVVRMVPEEKKAYHVKGAGWNDRSIGIEHEVRQTPWPGRGRFPLDDWTAPMLEASASLCAMICRKYGIPADRRHIRGHSEIPGADHHDPGPAFPWDAYLADVDARRRG